MQRGIMVFMILVCLSACAGGFRPTETPTLSPSPEMSATPLSTRTISVEEMTAFATYRPTLPATFTPTFTPTITQTPSITPTALNTATRTPIPELLFCPSFRGSSFAPQGRQVGIRFNIPFDFDILVEIINRDTGEVLESSLLTDRDNLTVLFNSPYIPAGNYTWRVSLQDASRTGMCPLEGEFTIIDLPTPTATITSELTAEVTAELTAESTEALNATPSATRRTRNMPQATQGAGN